MCVCLLLVFTFGFYFWFLLLVFWGAPREKIFTFEKTNSFKRGGVLAGFVELVTIITGVGCWGAQVGGLFFQK